MSAEKLGKGFVVFLGTMTSSVDLNLHFYRTSPYV